MLFVLVESWGSRFMVKEICETVGRKAEGKRGGGRDVERKWVKEKIREDKINIHIHSSIHISTHTCMHITYIRISTHTRIHILSYTQISNQRKEKNK